ncbi:riboflavin kinase / FMN adenylyltransferase [Fontimonas thermophila]|uniref:Riboflavin biosynthesis protein n=1 Tax=Fontimonas thermophila TaxID=1076937 RepID=A0A1I2KMH9_9GAMM|nr:bifunctional riboflavin kinase/FAD synthetase [Fontimonas thermophila]SFF66126.1 riboflavin kinase / FMN adenylyltransferase [Fontimonas thermophila]
MKLVRGIQNWPADERGCALTIGNFDGIHRGHQQLVRRTVELGHELGVPSAILSFEPTPREYFCASGAPGRIGTLRGKLRDLEALGLDRLIVQRFGRAFATLEAPVFIHEVLVQRLGVRALVVGDDFRFGARRAGDLDLLRQAGQRHGFHVEAIASVVHAGVRCSSTAVREALACADLERAEDLLGRPYALVGRVRGGLKLGRRLGMPTANVVLRRMPALRMGVYAVTLRVLNWAGAPAWPGVANLGVRPTLGLTRCLLETHVLGECRDLYGLTVEICFRRFLRPEARFDSLEALGAQMQRDKAAALAFFASKPA